jgi:hypothetical protein
MSGAIMGTTGLAMNLLAPKQPRPGGGSGIAAPDGARPGIPKKYKPPQPKHVTTQNFGKMVQRNAGRTIIDEKGQLKTGQPYPEDQEAFDKHQAEQRAGRRRSPTTDSGAGTFGPPAGGYCPAVRR